jgi:hypothetical protein
MPPPRLHLSAGPRRCLLLAVAVCAPCSLWVGAAAAQTVTPSTPDPPAPLPRTDSPGCTKTPAECLLDTPTRQPAPPRQGNQAPAPNPLPPSSTPDCDTTPGDCTSPPPGGQQQPGGQQPSTNPQRPPVCDTVSTPAQNLLPQCGNGTDNSVKPDYCGVSNISPLLLPECGVPPDVLRQARRSPVDCRPAGGGGPTEGLGACSPMCRDGDGINTSTRDACKVSGSIARAYPLASYGLDVNADFGITHPENLILGALQDLLALIWQIFLHITDGLLMLLEWAFSLDLLSDVDVMQRLREGLTTFHERVLGDGWTLVALSIAALWGIWYGLVHRKTIDTLVGLVATLALMILALLIIYRPEASILPLSNAANQGSKEVLSGVARGQIDEPDQGFADVEQGLFNAVILRPWCALQFGDVQYCLEQRKDAFSKEVRPKHPGELSVADAWLQFPAGSEPRTAIFKMTAGEDVQRHDPDFLDYLATIPSVLGTGIANIGASQDERLAAMAGAAAGPDIEHDVVKRVDTLVWQDPPKVSLQTGPGVFNRFALLAIILVGLLGALVLFGWLAVRLLLAAVFSLMYILMTPVLLLVAACGIAGRASVVAAAKRGLGQVVAKFIYALLLALAVLEANILSSLNLGFYATWLLQIAFWWGFFLKRHDFLGFLSLDQRAPASGGLGMGSDGSGGGRGAFSFTNLYYGTQMARGAARTAVRAVTAAPRASVRRLRRTHLERATSDSAAIREQARNELALRARRDAQVAHDDRLAEPRRVLAADERRRRRLAELSRERKPHEPEVLFRRRRLHHGGTPAREALQKEIAANESKVRAAKSAIEEAGTPRELSERDVDQWIEARRRDLDARPPEAEQNLRAAGILPSDYAAAGEAEREAMQRRSARIMQRDHELLGRLGDARQAGGPAPAPLPRAERRQAFRESVEHGTFGDMAERARQIRRDAIKQERFERKSQRLARGRRRVR